MSLTKDLTGKFVNENTTEFPDTVILPLNDKRSGKRTTNVRGGVANFGVNLLQWIQNKIDNNKITVPSSDPVVDVQDVFGVLTYNRVGSRAYLKATGTGDGTDLTLGTGFEHGDSIVIEVNDGVTTGVNIVGSFDQESPGISIDAVDIPVELVWDSNNLIWHVFNTTNVTFA